MIGTKCVLDFSDTSYKKELDNGKTIYLASYWNELMSTNQDAIVKHPSTLSGTNHPVEVEEGDKVYVHHFIVQPDRHYDIKGRKYAELEYEHIYCKIVDDEIKMIGDYVFLERLFEDESTCTSPSGLWLKDSPDEVYSVGILRHANKDTGIETGTKVVYSRLSDYEMVVEGEKLLRMKNEDLLAIYNK